MFDMNDPRLTAYVLGELDDPSRVELEAELERSPELRRAVEELRRAAEFLRETLHSEPAPSLTDTQRDAIHAASRETSAAIAVGGNSKPEESPFSSPEKVAMNPQESSRATWWLVGIGLAAVLLVSVISAVGFNLLPGGDTEVAMQGKPAADKSSETKTAYAPAETPEVEPSSADFDSFGADLNADPSQSGAYAAPHDETSRPLITEAYGYNDRRAEDAGGERYAGGGYGERMDRSSRRDS
ncbi:MAG: hypothetical protein KY475_04340, partial [Planctomycetes bacterium]|nr:hypothetical protein [Planctomycetota bacterium]